MNTHMVNLYAAMGKKPRLKDVVDDDCTYLDYEEYGDILEEASMMEAAAEYQEILDAYNEEIAF